MWLKSSLFPPHPRLLCSPESNLNILVDCLSYSSQLLEFHEFQCCFPTTLSQICNCYNHYVHPLYQVLQKTIYDRPTSPEDPLTARPGILSFLLLILCLGMLSQPSSLVMLQSIHPLRYQYPVPTLSHDTSHPYNIYCLSWPPLQSYFSVRIGWFPILPITSPHN